MKSLRAPATLGSGLIALGAALWGTDALMRRPLAHSTAVATIVFGEHAFLVLLFAPLVVPALWAIWRAGARYLAAAVVIGAGGSAIATILFTEAFVKGDPVTPVVIQKVQPIVAVAAARVLLGERPRRGFIWLFVAAIIGAWLIAFPSPLNVHPGGQTLPSLLALAAAVLWAFGTVLGRYLSRVLSFWHILTLRFVFGLPASAAALLLLGAPAWSSLHDSAWIALLAFITGALALALYYFGLKRTPAVAATLAELAFPITAAIVGFAAFGATLEPSQWIGVGLTSLVVLALPTRQSKAVLLPAEPLLAAA